MSNPRGFAYKTFHKAYDHLGGWSWFVTMRANQLAPTRNEYVFDCLNLWDRMYRNETELEPMRELAWSIAKWQSASMFEGTKGVLRMPVRTRRYESWQDTTDFTDPKKDTTKYWEAGYELVDEADEIASRLRKLSKHLTYTQLEMVGRYVQMRAPTFVELAADLGYSTVYVQRTFRYIRATAERMRI